MKIKHVFVASGIVLTSFAGAHAESVCGTKITYKWKQGDAEREEVFTTLKSKGSTEEEAKGVLKSLSEKSLKDAAVECKSAHENLSGCMSVRYGKLGSVYNTMAFQVRKQMDEAVRTDCEKSQGQCLGATAADEPCVTIEATKAAEASDAGAQDKSKDKKEAKK
jgi:hypothetical protein